jgi:hypothetical protein
MVLTLHELYNRFQHLLAQYRRREISQQAFVQAVQSMQAQDAHGNWWMMDPGMGHFLKFDGDNWIPSPAPIPIPARSAPKRRAQPVSQKRKGRGCFLSSPFMATVYALFAAFVWLFYANFTSSAEAFYRDWFTPFLMAGLPILLQVLRKPLNKLLRPLDSLYKLVPRIMRIGMAFGLPLFFGIVFSRGNSSDTLAGFSALRNTTFWSVMGAYFLTRR